MLCFDADGVVVNPKKQFSIFREKQYGMTPEMTEPFFNGVFLDCLKGKTDLLDVLPSYLQAWHWQESTREFIRVWHETEHVIDERLMLFIQKMRRQGLLCCLATNQEKHRAAYMRERMVFQDLFDHLFISCEFGSMKPEPAYYQAIQKQLGCNPAEILFWDDTPRHVKAAREQGWHAEQYTDFDGFMQCMESNYVLNYTAA